MLESSVHVGGWRSVVAWTAHEEYKPAPPLPAGTAAVLVVEFVMPRPKSLPKKQPTKPHTSRPDVDKLLRAIGDALTGVVWADDGQCVQSVGSKRYAEPGEGPGARIMVGT